MENLQVMVTLFVIVVLGYALNRLGYMNADFDKKLSSIVVDITCPMLILSSVMGDTLPNSKLIMPLLCVGFLTYIILTAIAYSVPRLITKNAEDRGIIGFAMMFGNVGFIGYPVVASIFGDNAVFYAALLNMANTFFVFTVGVALIKGNSEQHENNSLAAKFFRTFNPKVLLSPGLIAAILSTIIVAFRWKIPEAFAVPVRMIGNVTVPASLLVIGSSMAQMPFRKIVGNRTAYISSVFRLSIIPLSIYFLFRAIGIDAIVNDINTVVIAMPVASFGTMFCLKMNRDVSLMTEMTFITTIASIITIPLITMLFKA